MWELCMIIGILSLAKGNLQRLYKRQTTTIVHSIFETACILFIMYFVWWCLCTLITEIITNLTTIPGI